MSILLEVIVTSVLDAIEAEAGGAGRLELVAALEYGGLTPNHELVREVLSSVSIPVRVMLRETPSMSVSSLDEIRRLRSRAKQLAALPIDGLVTGFIKDGSVDLDSMRDILAPAPATQVTFHRAFDAVQDQLYAIDQLKQMPQIDRLLTDGGAGSWDARRLRVANWQSASSPPIQVVFATGTDVFGLPQLNHQPGRFEVHVGRAARVPQTIEGLVRREQVAALTAALG
jgi:copper homeostasis protein